MLLPQDADLPTTLGTLLGTAHSEGAPLYSSALAGLAPILPTTPSPPCKSRATSPFRCKFSFDQQLHKGLGLWSLWGGLVSNTPLRVFCLVPKKPSNYHLQAKPVRKEVEVWPRRGSLETAGYTHRQWVQRWCPCRRSCHGWSLGCRWPDERHEAVIPQLVGASRSNMAATCCELAAWVGEGLSRR